MKNRSLVRANFAVSLLRRAIRSPIWQRLLLVALLMVAFGIYFNQTLAIIDGRILIISILIVTLAAWLFGAAGGVSNAVLLIAIEIFFIARAHNTGLLETVSNYTLLNLSYLVISGLLVGFVRSVILEAQRDLEDRIHSDDELRRCELRFQTVADLTYNWEAWQDPDDKLLYMSPSVKRFTGYTPDDFDRNPDLLHQITLEEDRPALEAHFVAAQGQNPLHQVDIRIRHADGHIVWLRHICQPVYDGKGAFQGRRASNLDITEIRQANEELKRRVELEHLISEISSHFIDAPDHEIEENLRTSLREVAEFVTAERAFLLTFSPGALVIEKIYQWSKNNSEMRGVTVGKDMADYPWVASQIRANQVIYIPSVGVLPPEAAPDFKDWDAADRFSLLAIPLISETNTIGYFGISTLSSKITWNDDDLRSLRLLAEIYTNLVDRLRIQGELINSELRFRSTFENAGIGIALVDDDSFMLDVNPMMCEMFGYSREELIGHRTDEITHPDDRHKDYEMVLEMIRTNVPSNNREIRYFRKDGRLFWGRLTISLVWNKFGKKVHGIGMLEDITEQRRISEELQRRQRILEAVSSAAESLLRLSEWESGVQRALESLGSASQCYHVYVLQLENETDSHYLLRPKAFWSVDGSEGDLTGSWTDRVLHAAKASPAMKTLLEDHILTGPYDQFPQDMREKLADLNIARMLILPIYVENKVWGFLSFDSDRDSAWSAAEEEGLKIAADVFGAAYQRRQVERQVEQLYQAEHDQRRMAEALRDTAEALNASLNLQEVFAQVLLNVEKVVPLDAANIMLIDNGLTRVVGARGYAERGDQERIMNFRVPVTGLPNLNTMFSEGRPVITTSVSQDPRWVMDNGFPWIQSFAGAPIRQDNRTIGFLNVDSVTPNLFTPAHAERLKVFADQASLAIRNAGLFDDARRRAQQIALLNQMAQAAISAATQDEMLNHMVNHLAALFDADSAAILLFDKSGQFPRVAATVGEAIGLKGQISNAELAGFLLVEHPLEIEDLSKRPDVKSAAALLHPCRALLALPMVLEESRLGVVLVGFKQIHRISPAEVTLGEQAALQVALGISKAQLIEAERTRTHQLARANNLFTALEHVATRISAAADSNGVIKTLETELRQLDLSYAIALLDSSTNEMLLQYYSFRTHPDWRNSHDQIAHIFDREEFKHPLQGDQSSYYIPDPMRMIYAQGPKIDPQIVRQLIHLAGFDDQTHMFLLPLIVKEHPIGMLAVWGALQEDDRTVMSTFASQLAVAFYNASLYEEIQRVAITDEMTGLFNRRGMHEFGEREVERARRFDRPLSALMIDLDLFSRVNNTYGHLVGDEVLRQFAERVRANIRELDVAVRFGGEEFLILLVETDANTAINVGERIRQAIAAAPFETSAGALRITTSIGVAEMTPEMTGITHLIARADQALYMAKQTGRNRVSAG